MTKYYFHVVYFDLRCNYSDDYIHFLQLSAQGRNIKSNMYFSIKKLSTHIYLKGKRRCAKTWHWDIAHRIWTSKYPDDDSTRSHTLGNY